VIYVFRIYRKMQPQSTTPTVESRGDGVAAAVRRAAGVATSAIGTARDTVQRGLARLQGSDVSQRRYLEKEYRLPLVVERFDRSPELRTQFSYTHDGYFLDTAPNGRGVTYFSIAGRSFWQPVVVNGVAVDGDSAIQELQYLIDDYLQPAGGRLTSDYELYWLDLTAPVSAQDPIGEYEWLIHPSRAGLRTGKVAQRPWTFSFSLEFIGLRSNRDLAKAEDGLWSFLISRSFLGGLVTDLGLEDAVAAIRDVMGVLEEVEGLISDVNNVVVAVNDYVNAGVQAMQIGVAKVRSVIAGVKEVRARIEDGIQRLRDLPETVGAEFGLLARDFPGLVTGGESRGIAALAGIGRMLDFLHAVSANAATAEQRDTTTLVAVAPGVTLEQVAFQAQVSTDTLIALNGLQFPFVVGAPRPTNGALPGVIYAGESLRVPTPARRGLPPSVVPMHGQLASNVEALTGEAPTEEDRLFGFDFLLDGNGLRWDEDARDIVLDRGLDHIAHVQDRYVRLPLGTLRYAPQLGNFAYDNLGDWQTPGTNELLAAALYRTLQQDPRVAEIRSMRAETYAGAARLTYDLLLINGATVADAQVTI